MKQKTEKYAVTGGIGSGKSYLLSRLADAGFPVYSCDEINRKLLARPDILAAIRAYFPECMRSLAACGCSIVLFLSEGLRPVHSVLMRAYAYLYGVPVIGCAGRTALFAETSGGLATSNLPLTLFETSRVPCWRTVASRMRGAAEDDDADF